MLRNAKFSVGFATAYIFLYCLLLQINETQYYAFIMFLFFPVVMLWMVYTVLKYGKHNRSILGDDEFGYQDKKREELAVV